MVTLSDSVTRLRRVYYLGEFNSPESREHYHRVIAAWEAAGRRLPEGERVTRNKPADGPTINELTLAYWEAEKGCSKQSRRSEIRQTTRVLNKLFGSLPATEFGPNKLRLVRDAMVAGDPSGKRPRRPWSRTTINKRIFFIQAIFRWGVSHEMLPPAVYQALMTVESLRRGQTPAAEPRTIRSLPMELINAVEPFVSRQIWALIQLQLLTGARGGELFRLRKCDIDCSDSSGIWTYSPSEHKTAHHGHARTIYFGPKAKAVLQPFLLRPDHACLFSPAEAERERRQERHEARKTPLSCGNRPGSSVKDDPARQPGEHYTKDSYVRAIQRACLKAFRPPEDLTRQKVKGSKGVRWETPREWKQRLGLSRWQELLRHRQACVWHPHQLRHTSATLIRRKFGLEAAQIALGHSSALVTEAIYAERDMSKVREVMLKIG